MAKRSDREKVDLPDFQIVVYKQDRKILFHRGTLRQRCDQNCLKITPFIRKLCGNHLAQVTQSKNIAQRGLCIWIRITVHYGKMRHLYKRFVTVEERENREKYIFFKNQPARHFEFWNLKPNSMYYLQIQALSSFGKKRSLKSPKESLLLNTSISSNATFGNLRSNSMDTM